MFRDLTDQLTYQLYKERVDKLLTGLRLDTDAPNTYPHVISDSFSFEIDDSGATLRFDVNNGRTVARSGLAL